LSVLALRENCFRVFRVCFAPFVPFGSFRSFALIRNSCQPFRFSAFRFSVIDVP
jgi:hypothetical protein